MTTTFLQQAVSVAHGLAGAYLGLWEQAFELLSTQGQGPIPAAAAEALLTAGLCARALGRPEAATALLNEAYAVVGIDDSVRATIAKALSDAGYGIRPTTAARIDARSDYWDPATEPGEREYTHQLGAGRREELKAEATEALAEFVGMADIKDQIARLESSVRAAKQREALGLPVRNKSLHLVLKGPPGVGKTTVARVIGKLLCAAEVLPVGYLRRSRPRRSGGRVIGGSENKIIATIQRILDAGGGVLFIDEAYALTDSGSDNDYGPLVIAELVRAMVNYADKLMVIAPATPTRWMNSSTPTTGCGHDSAAKSCCRPTPSMNWWRSLNAQRPKAPASSRTWGPCVRCIPGWPTRPPFDTQRPPQASSGRGRKREVRRKPHPIRRGGARSPARCPADSMLPHRSRSCKPSPPRTYARQRTGSCAN